MLPALRAEIDRVRADNKCERWRRGWISDQMVSKELEALLDHVEKELAAIGELRVVATKAAAAKAGK